MNAKKKDFDQGRWLKITLILFIFAVALNYSQIFAAAAEPETTTDSSLVFDLGDDPFYTGFAHRKYVKTDSIFKVEMEGDYDLTNLSQETINLIELEKWKNHDIRSRKKQDLSFALVTGGFVTGTLFFLWLLNRR